MLCSLSSTQGFFNSIHTVQEQVRHKTSLCLTCHMEYNFHFLWFVIQQPHHCFSKRPLTVLPYPQHQKDSTQLSERIFNLLFWEAEYSTYLLLCLSFLPIALSFSLLEPSVEVLPLQETFSRVLYFMQAPSSLSV